MDLETNLKERSEEFREDVRSFVAFAWRQLAKVAWGGFLAHGRGVVAVDWANLQQSGEEGVWGRYMTFPARLQLDPRNQVLADILEQYDPNEEIMLGVLENLPKDSVEVDAPAQLVKLPEKTIFLCPYRLTPAPPEAYRLAAS